MSRAGGRPWLGALVAAVEFFTRIPRPAGVAYRPEHGALAPALAPLVGWLVGAVCTGVFAIAALVFPLTVAAALAVAAGVVLTGALHEDGFADVCDAFGAMGDRARALAIMKDSRSGAYAVVGVALLLVLRVAALAGIAGAVAADARTALLALTLVGGHAASRLAGLAVSATLPYARGEDTRSVDFVQPVRGLPLALGAACGIAPALLAAALGWPEGALALIPTAVAALWLRRLFATRFGGWTGDCIGASQQATLAVFELAVLAQLAPMP